MTKPSSQGLTSNGVKSWELNAPPLICWDNDNKLGYPLILLLFTSHVFSSVFLFVLFVWCFRSIHKERYTDNRHQLWDFQDCGWLGVVLCLQVNVSAFIAKGARKCLLKHRKGAIIVVGGRWLLTCTEYCLWIKLQESRWSQGWWKAGLIMDTAKTLCESLSRLQQLTSTVMRDCKYSSPVRDGIWLDRQERQIAATSFNCYLPGCSQRGGRNIFHKEVKNKKISEISLNKAALEKPFAWAQVNNKFGLRLMHDDDSGKGSG